MFLKSLKKIYLWLMVGLFLSFQPIQAKDKSFKRNCFKSLFGPLAAAANAAERGANAFEKYTLDFHDAGLRILYVTGGTEDPRDSLLLASDADTISSLFHCRGGDVVCKVRELMNAYTAAGINYITLALTLNSTGSRDQLAAAWIAASQNLAKYVFSLQDCSYTRRKKMKFGKLLRDYTTAFINTFNAYAPIGPGIGGPQTPIPALSSAFVISQPPPVEMPPQPQPGTQVKTGGVFYVQVRRFSGPIGGGFGVIGTQG